MNRRLVLKQLAMATTAAWLLPSCVSDPKKVSIALNNLRVTGDEENLVAEIAETIIPATDTPGAKAVGAHLFTLVMVDDCLKKDEQEKYLKGMRSFEASVKKTTGKDFLDSSSEEKLQILTTLEKSIDDLPEEVREFYETTKALTIQGYTTSEHFLTEIQSYKLVPGPNFKGCVPVSDQKTPV